MAAEAKVEDDYVYTVYILYGPTNVCGLVKHRTGRIENVMAKLEEQGFNVNLKRISDYGMVAFAFEGLVMFSCAAKNLSFGGCSSFDPLADKVIRSIVAERNNAINRARVMSWNRMVQQAPLNLSSIRKITNLKTRYDASDTSSETSLISKI